MSGDGGVDHVEMTLMRALIAFELTRINSRLDAIRVKVIRENTHIMKIGKDLIRVNAISQAFINLF